MTKVAFNDETKEMSRHVLKYDGKTPDFDSTVFVAPGAFVIGDVTIGKESSVWFNVVIRGDIHYVRIGKRTNIQDNSVIHVTSHTGPVNIGDEVTIGHGAILHGCTIEDRCLIGMGAIILDGAVIEKNCIVAAGALVPPGKRFRSGSLVLGSPATVSRMLTEEELNFLILSANHYVETSSQYIQMLHR